MIGRLAPSLAVASLLLAGCFPKLDPKLAEIPKLPDLKNVMHANETIGGQSWGLIGQDSYTDAEYAKLRDTGERFNALSLRAKEFTRGPVFDKHVESWGRFSGELVTSANAKDAKAASASLDSMKKLCKECHSATR